MNPLLKLILFLIALLFFNQLLYAQSDQLDRDIRIAERILEEIFTPEPSSGERQVVLPFSRGVESEYIPGVGIHFKVGQARTPRIRISGGRQAGDDENKTSEVTIETVENRMMEYFTQYAGQLRGLPDNEQVRVTFGEKTTGPRMVFFSASGEQQHQLPRLTMWVTKAEINRFADGNLSESQFRNRISKHEITDSQDKRDLIIFASVLETSINSTDSKHLKVNRKPTYEYLPALGAHFHVNVSSGVGFSLANIRGMARQIDSLDLDDVDIRIDLGDISANIPPEFNFQSPQIEFRNDSLRIALRAMSDSLRVHANELSGHIEVIREQAEAAQRQGQEIQRQIAFSFAERDTVDLTEDAAKLMVELKAAIKDYGSTLSSLGDNELLMITVNWSGRNPTLPERTHIRISKEDLFFGREPFVEEIKRR
ncbi:MAG: hypothetical protein EA390_06625 [Balneolaceae bacterium]|nr:MAG: hypothetical protein EA390_06625 [Balneolaceae bacterium]